MVRDDEIYSPPNPSTQPPVLKLCDSWPGLEPYLPVIAVSTRALFET